MLLDVKASKIYTLDVNRSPESIVRRESNMTKICHALGKIFVHSRNLVNFRHTNPDPSNWGHFIYPQGLPKDLDRLLTLTASKRTVFNFAWCKQFDKLLTSVKTFCSAESAIWCLSLLQHNGGFSTKLFRHMGNSEHMRMRAALNIVQSDVNQCRGFIDSKAEVVWRLITSCNDKDSMSGGGL
ncbi:uncharacterized protein LOC107624419 [Arachis ipaensis]|uniref:uncharacterized protein LOC107624419 n=1 Tax=Arachis ipaensis TaxID=130454 RepID=UPI0007AEEF56|nr:uncharacterized protein LOC107624419 [Arachis ipaensis]